MWESFIALFPTLDALILAAFCITLLLHFVFVRITRIFVDIVSVYASFFIVVIGPLFIPAIADWIGFHPLVRAGLFVGFVLFLHYVLWKSNVGSFSRQLQVADVMSSIVYRTAVVGLFFSTVLFFTPNEIRNGFGTIVTTLFANMIALGIWFIVPFFGAFAYRHHTKRGWIQ